MNSWAQGEGQPGLGYIFFREDGEGAGPIAKNIGPERTEAIREQLEARGRRRGLLRLRAAGRASPPSPARRARRSARDLELVDEDQFALLLDRRFPDVRVERGGEEDRLLAQPVLDAELSAEKFLALDPADRETILGIKAIQYDIVCNGIELSSGAIRNHKPEIMRKAFEIAGYGARRARGRSSAACSARFQYGAPPHGGIAPGIDRIVMLLCGEENLREVTLFPMNQRAEDLLMGAPSEVSPPTAPRAAHPRRAAGVAGSPGYCAGIVGRMPPPCVGPSSVVPP